VALQGTLDTFALPDVLRLLATTRKTGRLVVRGNRGDGSVWIDSGSVVGANAASLPPASTPGEVIFELLRHTEGSFTFDSDATPTEVGAPAEVEPLLLDAERLLAEWRSIEAVVPSLDAWVTLAPELPGAEAVVDASRWRTIVAVGGGTTVGAIGEVLGLGEVPVSRLVKDLVELGFGTVAAAAPATDGSSGRPAAVDPFVEQRTSSGDLSIDFGPFGGEPVAASNGSATVDPFAFDSISPEPAASRETPPAPALRTPPPLPQPLAESSVPEDEPMEADEVARQLAALSPKAAKAVAAAAKAETAEEREAALAELATDDDEPINRGLLLKFLSSVRS
jgi:hypothetical protein